MAATVMAEDDLVEQLLADPAWSAERISFFEKVPEEQDSMWLGDYKRIRQDFDRNDPQDIYRAKVKSTEYYEANREDMDRGAVVTWTHCFAENEGEISAVQHGMNALVDMGEEYFASEYQNKPRRETSGDNLTINHLKNCCGTIERAVVPGWANCVTAAIDVHDDLLYYTVVSWDRDTFSGHIIDFGVYPEQKDNYFKQGSIKQGIPFFYKNRSKEAAIRAALDKLTDRLINKEYPAQDGSLRHIDRVLIDSGYQGEIIFRSVLESDSRLFFPSKGEFYGAKGKEFNEITRKRKQSAKSDILNHGDGWRACRVDKYRDLQRVFYDSNAWKTFVRERLKSSVGTDGELRMFAFARGHELFFDHMLSEKGVEVEAKGRRVIEWDNPQRRDNHWWDTLVYSTIAASMEGCRIKGAEALELGHKAKRKRRRIGC